MNSLVQEMLDLSRAEQVELNFHDATTPVREVVHQVYNNFKMIHPDFEFMLDDDLRHDEVVKIYRDHLEQILIILCDNAVKYSGEQKRIHLSLSATSRPLKLGYKTLGKEFPRRNCRKSLTGFTGSTKPGAARKGAMGSV